jgi:hypothetical protein
VSSRRSYRPFDERGESKRSFLGVAGHNRLRWRDVRPVFLKSAGAVGLAGMIVAAISNDSLFSQPEPQQRAIVLAAHDAARDEPAPAAPEPGAFAVTTAPKTAAPPPALAPPPEVKVARVAPAPAAPLPAAASDSAAALTSEPSGAEPEAAQPSSTGSLWSEHAVECPRDWVPVEGTALPGPDAQDCGKTAAPLAEVAAVGVDQGALDEAALERATEIAALQFVPRIPLARPDPPERPRRKASSKGRAGWPAGSPPNCGKKRAKWRYVSNVPTWYCR